MQHADEARLWVSLRSVWGTGEQAKWLIRLWVTDKISLSQPDMWYTCYLCLLALSPLSFITLKTHVCFFLLLVNNPFLVSLSSPVSNPHPSCTDRWPSSHQSDWPAVIFSYVILAWCVCACVCVLADWWRWYEYSGTKRVFTVGLGNQTVHQPDIPQRLMGFAWKHQAGL